MKKIIPKSANLIPKSACKVFSGAIFDVYQWQQELYDGSFATFESLKRPDTVSVFVFNENNEIIVLEDEQPHRKMVLALPGGRVDGTDNSVLDAAKREVLEETGYELKDWKLIWVEKPQEKLEWFVYSYIACGVKSKQQPHVDAGERIKVGFRSFDEVKALALNGEKRFKEQEALVVSKDLTDFLNFPEFVGIEVDL